MPGQSFQHLIQRSISKNQFTILPGRFFRDVYLRFHKLQRFFIKKQAFTRIQGLGSPVNRHKHAYMAGLQDRLNIVFTFISTNIKTGAINVYTYPRRSIHIKGMFLVGLYIKISLTLQIDFTSLSPEHGRITKRTSGIQPNNRIIRQFIADNRTDRSCNIYILHFFLRLIEI